MTATEPRYALPNTGRGLARQTTLGVAVAVAAVLIAQVAVTALGLDVGATGAMSPFSAGPLVVATVVAGAGAAVVCAGLIRFTGRPVRNFVAVSAAVFGVQLIPVVTLAPSLGVTPVGQAVLVIYHVIVAVPIVAALLGIGAQ